MLKFTRRDWPPHKRAWLKLHSVENIATLAKLASMTLTLAKLTFTSLSRRP